MDCIYCYSDHTSKNGKLKSGGQRWKCVDCSKQFSLGGARDTYTPEFKEKVINEYCHSPVGARTVLKKYGISSKTLIERKKNHLSDCKICTK